MTQFTDASHNVLFRLNAAQWAEDFAKSGTASLVGYQEAEGDPQRRALAAWCKANGRGLFHPDSCGNPISWDTKVWAELQVNDKPFQGKREVHAGAVKMGLAGVKFNPGRDFAWKGLTHRGSGQNVLRINVHPVAGGTDPTPEEGEKLTDWKDWAIGQYWLEVVAFTARHLSVQRTSDPKERAGLWDAILLGGDYNADFLDQRGDQWYYPNRLLPSLYRADPSKGGLDHMQATHGADVKVVKRWSVPGNTDHRIHFCTWALREVEDFPGTPS